MNYKILNLIKPALSDIPYHINKYPDGHKHIVLEGCKWNKDFAIDVLIRIDSIDMLFILMQVGSILNHENIRINELHITYLLTARCERRFSMGEAIDLDLLGDVLLKLNARKYIFYDAHNLPSKFKKLKDVENNVILSRYLDPTNYNICYPDEGAQTRYRTKFGSGDLIGVKHRKPDGISITLYPIHPLDIKKPILVIDDLCDGGGTFVALANDLDKICPKYEREIWVTHAIQKSGINLLAANYDKVYITNSYTDWNSAKFSDNVTVYNVCQL